MKRLKNSPATIPLVEHMYTIQGEGVFQGHAAYFIRLAGCDVGCVWCDTKHSWEFNRHPKTSVHEVVQDASRSGAPIAVITGGEPTLHNLSVLTRSLKEAGMRTHLETAGTYPLTGEWDWICLSPKKFKKPLLSMYPRANELKIVVCHKSDLQWAEQQTERISENCELFLQPEWSEKKKYVPLILDYVQKHPRWKMSLQLHKYIQIP